MKTTQLVAVASAFLGLVAALPHPSPTTDDISQLLTRDREPACETLTQMVDDGDPHQTWYELQVTQPITCADGGCSVSHLTSHTIGYSASAGVAQWISGGFSVEESWTTGDTYTCNGNPGETICVWANVAHTAYTVQNYGSGGCLDTPDTTPYVLQSPNDNNAGGGYYCVVGTCRNDGDGYWNGDSVAGGPPA